MSCGVASNSLRSVGRACLSFHRRAAVKLLRTSPCRTFGDSTDSEPTDLATDKPEDGVKACLRAKTGQRIEIVQGNLLNEDVDALVNPTDTNLFHDSKLSTEIMTAAGYLARRQNEKLMNRHGSIPVGSVAVVTGGFLACHSIIHAITPKWQENGTEDDWDYCVRLLRAALHYSLLVCNDKRYYSVSVPGLGAGHNGWPKNFCCNILLETTLTFFETHPLTPLKYVCFADTNAAVVASFVNEAGRLSHSNLEAIERLSTAADNDGSSSGDDKS